MKQPFEFSVDPADLLDDEAPAEEEESPVEGPDDAN
jgi:hypothetical protein